MGFTISGLQTTIKIAGEEVTLHAEDLKLDPNIMAIKQQMTSGLTYSISQPITATLEQITTWIQEFDKTLGLPTFMKTTGGSGSGSLQSDTVIIQELSVTMSTENPGFSIGLQVTFAPGSLTIPAALTKWFALDSLGVSLAYAIDTGSSTAAGGSQN